MKDITVDGQGASVDVSNQKEQSSFLPTNLFKKVPSVSVVGDNVLKINENASDATEAEVVAATRDVQSHVGDSRKESEERDDAPPADKDWDGEEEEDVETEVEICDFDINPTLLFHSIKEKDWEHVLSLLEDQKSAVPEWLGNFLSQFEEKDERPIEQQARTWVVRREQNGDVRWRMLPLHAALMFDAPFVIIEKLLKVHPQGAQGIDDRGMLPLHLAFRNDASDDVIDVLIEAFPPAIDVENRKGNVPIECAPKDSSHTKRNSIIAKYLDFKLAKAKAELTEEVAKTLEERDETMSSEYALAIEELRQKYKTEETAKKEVSSESKKVETTASDKPTVKIPTTTTTKEKKKRGNLFSRSFRKRSSKKATE